MINKGKALEIESRFLINKLYQKRLTEASRFVCYKADKTPYNAKTRKRCDITNIINYSSYRDACHSALVNPAFEGIGFVLGYDAKNDTNFCGLDIDNCIDAQGKIHPKAIELIEILDTYTEISRSGRGIHCIFHARKPGDICKNGNLDFCKCLELYDNGRYFALTGNIIRDKNIAHRQKQCDRIYEMYFKHREIKAPMITKEPKITPNKSYGEDYWNYILKKDEKFKNYWLRTITIMDESANDLTFIIKLAYWLDDKPELIKEWFYKSPYYMGKDDTHKKKANRKDYIDRTINRAISFRRQGGN